MKHKHTTKQVHISIQKRKAKQQSNPNSMVISHFTCLCWCFCDYNQLVLYNDWKGGWLTRLKVKMNKKNGKWKKFKKKPKKNGMKNNTKQTQNNNDNNNSKILVSQFTQRH